jgi:hypothetical protein
LLTRVARSFPDGQGQESHGQGFAFRRKSIIVTRGKNGQRHLFRFFPNLIQTMQITKQLAIFLDNRPGTLARLADTLAEAKINIYAITTSDTVDHTVIRLVLSDYRKAIHVFEEHGTLVVEDDVLMVEGSNKPGEIARIAQTLAEAKVNIEYCYSATSPDAKKGLLILRVSNPTKALKALNS